MHCFRIEPSPPQIDSRQHVLAPETPEKMLSVSGKKKCSHCGDELGMSLHISF